MFVSQRCFEAQMPMIAYNTLQVALQYSSPVEAIGISTYSLLITRVQSGEPAF